MAAGQTDGGETQRIWLGLNARDGEPVKRNKREPLGWGMGVGLRGFMGEKGTYVTLSSIKNLKQKGSPQELK